MSKPKQANAFGCSLLLFIARFGFCRWFHLNIALLVLVFCWFEKPKRATKGKKVQMETRIKKESELESELESEAGGGVQCFGTRTAEPVLILTVC